MKKAMIWICGLCMILSLAACGGIKESLEVAYGQTHIIENDALEKYDMLTWESEDTSIATVDNGTITGVAPGKAIITAMNNEKVVASYDVTVVTIPATSIVLSTNTAKIIEDETLQLTYTLFPENASDYGLKWKSANEEVATVDANGEITAKKPGQTTISISNEDGFIATCSIEVSQKAAYDRLSLGEKSFVDAVLENMDQFKNPESLIIKAVQKDGTSWIVRVSAQNGFGGNNTTVYFLSQALGFWNWDSLDIDLDVDITPDDSYDIDLINEAIKEKR